MAKLAEDDGYPLEAYRQQFSAHIGIHSEEDRKAWIVKLKNAIGLKFKLPADKENNWFAAICALAGQRTDIPESAVDLLPSAAELRRYRNLIHNLSGLISRDKFWRSCFVPPLLGEELSHADSLARAAIKLASKRGPKFSATKSTLTELLHLYCYAVSGTPSRNPNGPAVRYLLVFLELQKHAASGKRLPLERLTGAAISDHIRRYKTRKTKPLWWHNFELLE